MAGRSRPSLKVLVVVAIASAVGWKAWSWQQGRDHHARARDKVTTATDAIEAWRSCLTAGHGEDVLTALISRRAAAPTRKDAADAPCGAERAAAQAAVAAVAPPRPEPAVGARVDWLASCAELRSAIGAVAAPAIARRVAIPSSPGCELGGRALIPVTLPPGWRDVTTRDVVAAGPDLVLSENSRGRGAARIAHTGSAKEWAKVGARRWVEVDLPPHVFELDWGRSGLVAVTWPDGQPAQVQRWDGSRWRAGATFTPGSVAWVRATGPGGLVVLGSERGRAQVETLRRSTDGGATLGPPIVLLDGADRHVQVRTSRSGAAVALAASTTGEPTFEARRLGPTDAAPAPTATLRWPGRGEGTAGLSVCTAGDSLWGLVQARYVVASTDGGARWAQVGDVGAELLFPRLACTPTALALYSRVDTLRGRTVRRCDLTGCAAPAALPPADDQAKVALAASAELVLWLAPHGLPRRDGDEAQVLRRLRVEPGALVDDGVWVVTPSNDALDVLVLDDEFVPFAALDGELSY